MSIVAADSSEPSLHAAIFQYFRWLSQSSSAADVTAAESTASASSSRISDEEDETGDKSNENTVGDDPTTTSSHSNRSKGNKVLAALMEEFPVELEKVASAAGPIAPPAPWVPDLKVRFDAYPFHRSRLEFVENRLAFWEQQRQNYSATTALPTAVSISRRTNALGSKRKDTPRAAPTNVTTATKRKDPPPSTVTAIKSPKKRKLSSPSLPAASVAASSNPVRTTVSQHTKESQEQPTSQTPAAVATTVNAENEEKKLVVSNNWEERYQQLLHFQKGYGHCRVPVRYTHVPGLGRWVQEQRAIYRLNPTLESEWVTKLNDIGFEWNVQHLPTKSWDDRFEELKEFQREHGSTRVPRSYKPDPSLGEWVHTQRSDYRKKASSLMESDRLSRLQAIGFEFRTDDGKKSWEERFEQLAEFRRTHGHINVPLPEKRIMFQGVEGTKDEEEKASSTIMRNQHDEDYRFADWVRKQKLCYRKYKSGDRSDLTRSRFNRLHDIGCGQDDDEPNTFATAQPPPRQVRRYAPRSHSTWNLRVDQLRSYKERFGDCEVPTAWPENRQLAEWVKTQRKAYRKSQAGETSRLTPARRAELEGLGFQWVVRPNQLKENRKNKEEKVDIECEETMTNVNGRNLYM